LIQVLVVLVGEWGNRCVNGDGKVRTQEEGEEDWRRKAMRTMVAMAWIEEGRKASRPGAAGSGPW
jgi:hypothetical protein